MAYPLLLHAKHRETSVTYESFGEWVVPWRFDSCETEYRALRTGVGLIDYSTQALIEVKGADRAGFLHTLLTNDITRLAPGHGCHAALLTASAKLIANLLVLADPDALWLLYDATRAAVVTQTLERYRFSEEVALTNHERREAVLALQGPCTLEFLSPLVGALDTLRDSGDHMLVRSFDDVPLRIVRHTLTGDPGVLCICPAEHAHTVWTRLAQHGQREGLTLAGWEALNTARIEAGIPWYGMDVDDSVLLPETGLETLLASETKGCYLGQEIIARMATYGSPNKKLVRLLVDAAEIPQAGDRIEQHGGEAGWVTSGCRSRAFGQPMALGYLKRGAYEPGMAVEILRGAQRLPATVASPASSGKTRAGG